jgi:hypothetical protein
MNLSQTPRSAARCWRTQKGVLFGALRLTPRFAQGRPFGRSTTQRRSQVVMWSVKRDSCANCPMDVATNSPALWPRIRKASRARAPDSPAPSEYMDVRSARPTKNIGGGFLSMMISRSFVRSQYSVKRQALPVNNSHSANSDQPTSCSIDEYYKLLGLKPVRRSRTTR